MPEEIVAITIISIIAGAIMTISLAKMLFSYLRDRAGLSGKNAGPSLTTSELETMLKRVVEQANAPLMERVEELEQVLSPRSKTLPPARREPILEDLNEEPEDLVGITKRQERRKVT